MKLYQPKVTELHDNEYWPNREYQLFLQFFNIHLSASNEFEFRCWFAHNTHTFLKLSHEDYTKFINDPMTRSGMGNSTTTRNFLAFFHLKRMNLMKDFWKGAKSIGVSSRECEFVAAV